MLFRSWSLRQDPRVVLRERTNLRHLTPEVLFGPHDPRPDLAVADVSFISLTLVLPAVKPVVRKGGYIIALVKPEFEAGRSAVGARGIVRSVDARQKALEKIKSFGVNELDLELKGSMHSPTTGGNREFIVCFRRKSE